ncbi:MAG: hypothetical protein LOY04_11975 [Rhodococcus ruber]|nr:hypothetical protein [Rhodococcus ruber]
MNPPTLSVNLPNFGDVLARDNYAHLVDVAVRAEESGVDRVNVTDHVVMGSDTSGYAWGPFATEPDAMWLEPMTVLAVIARRGDGYHEIETLMARISLADEVRVRVTGTPEVTFEATYEEGAAGAVRAGAELPSGSANLAVRAAESYLSARQ